MSPFKTDPEIEASRDRFLQILKLLRLSTRFFAVQWDYMQRAETDEDAPPPEMEKLFAGIAEENADGQWRLTEDGVHLLSAGRQMLALEAEHAEAAARAEVEEAVGAETLDPEEDDDEDIDDDEWDDVEDDEDSDDEDDDA